MQTVVLVRRLPGRRTIVVDEESKHRCHLTHYGINDLGDSALTPRTRPGVFRSGWPSSSPSRPGAFEHHFATIMAGSGSEIDDPVGMRHDRLVMFDHDHRFAGVDQPI